MRDFDEAIRRAHVRQVQASMRVMKWVIFGGIALGMALAALVVGGA